MLCPTCGLRQWNYDEATLTCKNGHRFPIGDQPPRFRGVPLWLLPATAIATFALDLLLRTAT